MKRKRLFSWLLTFAMIAGMFVVPASAEDNTITISGDGSVPKTGQMTITLKIKGTPTASDFTFTPPSELSYDGQPKTASVTGKDGMGDITLDYYSGDTKLSGAPTADGTYTVKVSVTEGTEYKAATGLTVGTFTIAPYSTSMTITLVIVDKDTQTITAENVTATYGDTGKKVTASLTTGNGTLSYAVKSGSDVIDVDAATGALTIKKAGTAVVTVTSSETNTGGTDNKGYAKATKEVTVTIAPAAPDAAIGYGFVDYSTEKFESTSTVGQASYNWSNYEISTSSDFKTIVSSGADVIASAKSSQTYYIRVKANETAGAPASTATPFTITRPNKPATGIFAVTDTSSSVENDGGIRLTDTSLAARLEYNTGSKWEDFPSSGVISNLGNGTYQVRYKHDATQGYLSSEAQSLTIVTKTIALTGASIKGAAKYGETLTAVLTGEGGKAPTGVTLRWNSSKQQNPVGTESTYTLLSDDIGQIITLTATQGDTTKTVFTGIVAKKDGSTTKPAVSENNITKSTAGESSTITVTDMTPAGKYEFSIDGGKTWQDSNTFTNLLPGGTYSVSVREKATETVSAGAASNSITVRTDLGTVPLESLRIVNISGDDNAIYVGNTLQAVPSPANATGVSYQWYADGEIIAGATGSTYVVKAAQNGQMITVKAGEVTSPATTAAQKANALPLTLLPTSISKTDTTIAVNGFRNNEAKNVTYQFAVVPDNNAVTEDDWADNSTFTSLTAGTSYDVYVRILETPTRFGSTSGKLNISTDKAHPFNQGSEAVRAVEPNFIYNTTAPEPSLNVVPSDGTTTTYYWSDRSSGTTNRDGSAPKRWSNAKPTGVGTYYIWAVIEGDSSHTGQFETITTVRTPFKIEKQPSQATTVTIGEINAATLAVSLTGGEGKKLEYAVVISGGTLADAVWTDIAEGNNSFTIAASLTSNVAYTVYVREKETATANASGTVSANVTPTAISVIYDANGGTGTLPTAEPTQGSVTVASGSGLTRTGYTFETWTKSDGTTEHAPNSQVTGSMTLYAKWKPNTYTVKFSDGTTQLDAISYGAELMLPPPATAVVGSIFLGWSKASGTATPDYPVGRAVKNLAADGEVNLYPVWIANTGNVSGAVSSNEGENVTLKLMRGDAQYGETVSVPMDPAHSGGYSGTFALADIPYGIYNLVIEQIVPDGNGGTETLTRTIAVTVGSTVEPPLDSLIMPTSARSALQVVGADTPPAVVDGLDKLAESEAVDERSVTVTMTVEKQEEQTVSQTATEEEKATQEAIKQLQNQADTASGSNGEVKEMDFLNINITKEVTLNGAVESSETIADTGTENIMEVIFPYVKPGDGRIDLWRFHGSPQKFNDKGSSRPVSPVDLDFYFAGGMIHLFTRYFSTYAVSYTETTSSGNNGDNSDSSSGGSGGSSGSTITVPVSGDSASVSVSASVSGTTATVKAPTTAQLDKVIGESVKTGDVTIDVSGLNKNITTVSIPKETVKAIEKAVSDPDDDADALTVKLTDGSVTFDAAALVAIVDQAKGSTIQLNLDSVGESKLKTAQKAAIKDMDVQAVYDAYLASNGQRISDFKGGKATVTVSYTLKEGQTGRGVVVWYVAEDGEKTEVPTTCDEKTVSFTVEHFSNYVIAYDAQRAAVCPKDDTCPISAFSDASATAWYHDGVHYVLENGIMTGYGKGKFGPNDDTSRAMVAQILWNMEGKPVVNYAMSYTDVDGEAWYTEAVRWATAQGIMNGYGGADGGKFGPNDDMTREQLAVILYRYAQFKGFDVSVGEDTIILSFADATEVSGWADAAMQWAVGNGIINGKDGKLVPKGDASRAEAATMLQRFCTLSVEDA